MDVKAQQKNIDVEDLQYVERDLCFYELVSLGFLLFGEDRTNAEFVLQKLLVLAHNYNNNNGGNANLLRVFANIKPDQWRDYLVEALAIIGARRVLRKLGFVWKEVETYYLPHIAELSLHVHPMLKALYKMCERLGPAEAGDLVLHINEQCKRPDEHLRFYDFAYLEIFLLDWISRRIISVGDHEASNVDVKVLLEYFKLNEMDTMKNLLLETIHHNSKLSGDNETARESIPIAYSDSNTSNETSTNGRSSNRMCELTSTDRYIVRWETAGIILIINQVEFYRDEKLKHLLPQKELEKRRGTEVDKTRLKEVFEEYGYKPEVFENLTHIELMHRIRETVKRSFQYDSLIVCILSHGIDGAVYGCDSIPVKISEIERIITDENLHGKPKLLIIQACQKNEASVDIEKRYDSSVMPDYIGDMVKAMSTVPGYSSMRHIIQGTWFIQSLCNAVEQMGDKNHLLDILVAVNREVSGKRGDKNEAMVPITSNTLRKSFYLPQRVKVKRN